LALALALKVKSWLTTLEVCSHKDGFLVDTVPGSFDGDCGKEEETWTCTNCNETLQLCPFERALYCRRGHVMASEFQFRCRSDAQGSDFKYFSDSTLIAAINRQKW